MLSKLRSPGLSAVGFRRQANNISMESFFKRWLSEPNLFIYRKAGAATLFGRTLVFVLACAACTMCVAVGLGNAIGIEAESPKCSSRSEAGLVADSPGQRHCQANNYLFHIMALRLELESVNNCRK